MTHCRKNPSYTALLRPTRLLISEKSATYTIKWFYRIIRQVRVFKNVMVIQFLLTKKEKETGKSSPSLFWKTLTQFRCWCEKFTKRAYYVTVYTKNSTLETWKIPMEIPLQTTLGALDTFHLQPLYLWFWPNRNKLKWFFSDLTSNQTLIL